MTAARIPLVTIAATLALAFTAFGCNPTFAPPPRTAHNVAPDRLERGEGEVAVSSSWYLQGSAVASFQISDEVALEGGVESGIQHWQLLSGGARLTLVDAHGERGGSVDLEAGLSGGVGGERCNNFEGDDGFLACESMPNDALSWSDRFAYGGYFGFGASYRVVRELQLYARGRVQLATATNIPTTMWGSALAGIELTFDPVMVHIAGGWGGYTNDVETMHGPLVEVGVGIRFDLSPGT